MSFFKNKHVIIAMIVAPLLAVLTYFAVDSVVKEKPHAAVSGHAYPLVAKSNCRFNSGSCDLENASFSTRMRVNRGLQQLELTSSHALQNATIGFVDENGKEHQPVSLKASDNSNKSWLLALPSSIGTNSMVRVALKASNAFYFAETTMQFSVYKTTFDKDFRK